MGRQNNFRFIDAHCDTLTELGKYKGMDDFHCACGQYSWSRQAEYDRFLQITALWVDCGREDVQQKISKYTDVFADNMKLADERFKSGITDYKVRQILSAKDAEEYFTGKRDGKEIAVMLSVEGGEGIGDSIDGVSKLYDRGVRLITLTWNTPYLISDTHIAPRDPAGLTAFGRQVVAEMNRLGMIIDVSHISDAGFWDVINLSRKPIVASHSNSRNVWNASRNLTDDMFKALIKNGGVTGMNFCRGFLGEEPDVETIVKHIEYLMALGGENSIGIGSDFDGIGKGPEGMDGIEDIYKIADRLLELNYTEEQVEKIAWKNFLRVITDVLH